MKRILLLLFFISFFQLQAEDWNTITTSELYYYGEGTSTEEDVAGKTALDNLLQMIAVNVSSDFEHIYDGVTTQDGLNFKDVVRQCVRTYSHNTLTNVKTWSDKKGNNYVVRKYMLKSELEQIYTERIERLKDMVGIADRALQKGNVDVALQYYYWAYSMVRSLQKSSVVKDDNGNILVNTLPIKIEKIISDIKIDFVSRDGDDVDLWFTYQGRPTSVDFTYNDGRKDGCDGKADGGSAYIEMAPGYAEQGIYAVNIEYEYKDWARGDAEMSSILAVIPRRPFGSTIKVKAGKTTKAPVSKTNPKVSDKISVPSLPKKEDAISACSKAIGILLDALQTHRYEKADTCFVGRGLDNFQKLISKRSGRLVGTPKTTLYTNACGNIVARGIQMSFSVTERGRKTTIVDDIVLTFDQNNKISNLTFGIGSIAENDLLSKNVNWGEDVRQQVLDFLENYKTAYCLKDTSYIRSIFDDNATIIVGHVAKRTTHPGFEYDSISAQGQEIITYKQFTKNSYLDHLKKTFLRNQFINIKFTENDVQKLDSLEGNQFSIKIGQEYTSSTYSDMGQLFLFVDMTNPAEPVIKIRTWQPKRDPELGWYGPGHFTKD